MKRIGWLPLYGFFTWFVGLALHMTVYPLKESGNPLFETIMTLVVSTLAVLATLVRFRRVRRLYVLEGLALGVALLLVNIVLDLPLFMYGPLAMPLTSYLGDIGLTYLVYPIVTTGAGLLLAAGVAMAHAEALASSESQPAAARPMAEEPAIAEAAAPFSEGAASGLPVAR